MTGFFLPVPPVQGGASEKIWDELARRFAGAGHEVTLVSRSWPGFPARETRDGVRHLRLPGSNHRRWLPLNLLHDLAWGLRVSRALPAGDVAVCNTPTLPAWLARRRPDAGRVVAVVARMPKGQARAYGRVDLLLALSGAVADALRRENPALARRVVPFPFPIDWARHAGAAAPRTSDVAATIGYVGRIHPEKGIRLLLTAASRLATTPGLPAWRLELTGPWSVPQGGGGEAFRAGLLAEFGSALGDRLHWHPPEFDSGQLARRYGQTGIFCYPSIAEAGETFGVAVAEAMAAGAAPVVSALPCFRELVQDGVTGRVFDHAARDAAARLSAILAGLLTNPAERRALAAHAQAHVQRYDFAVVARDVLGHFARLNHSPSRNADA